MKEIEVVAAVIENEGQILCVQRGDHQYSYVSKKYEFPGGKVEQGESLEQAIVREIFEELELTIQVEKHLGIVNHTYPDFKIKMHGFLCRCENRTLTLKEHLAAQWLNRKDLMTLDWAAADIPFVRSIHSKE